MDLLDQHRSLIHSGKLLRQPDSGLEWNGWSELFVLLFDNYRTRYIASSRTSLLIIFAVVLTKPKEKDGVTYYYVNRRVRFPVSTLCLTDSAFSLHRSIY